MPFLIYMVAAILNVAAVVVGPVFLALAVIPATRRFAAGWFGVLVGGCATQLMALAIIQLMSGAELTMMHTLFAPGAAADNNFVILAALVQVGVLLGLGGAVTAKIPDISRAVAHGVYHGSAGINAATFGMARQVTQAAAGGAARGARAIASGAIWVAGGAPGDGEGGVLATAELTMIQGFITAAAPAAGGDNSIVISVGPHRVGNAARAYGSGCKASPRDLSRHRAWRLP